MAQDSAAVAVYVLNPCAVPIPQQPSKQLIISLHSRHLPPGEADSSTATAAAAAAAATGGAASPEQAAAIAKPYQIQVPAKLNITFRGIEKFRQNARTSLRLRPQLPGVIELQARLLLLLMCCFPADV